MLFLQKPNCGRTVQVVKCKLLGATILYLRQPSFTHHLQKEYA